jgi:hypothetical protein
MILRPDIEQALQQQVGIYAKAEERGNTVVLSGLVESETDRQAARALTIRLAPGKRIVDRLELATILPEYVDGFTSMESEAGDLTSRPKRIDHDIPSRA